MVNYDCRGNPNRMEQRFRADPTALVKLKSVTSWNLVAKETAEAKVYHRTVNQNWEVESVALKGRCLTSSANYFEDVSLKIAV